MISVDGGVTYWIFWRNFDNTGLDWIGETGGEIKMLKLFVRITVNYLLGPSDYK